MAQQTLLPPQRQTTKEQAPKKESRPAPGWYRGPRIRGIGLNRRRSVVWGAAGLAVAFVLSLLAGVLLAVHGPSDSPPAGGGTVALQPKAPATAAPAPSTPMQPAKPAERGSVGDKPVKAERVKKIVLRSGDTLWELARAHGTSVKMLQRLNNLGSSTLIYAGKTLDVPSRPDSAGSAPQPKAPQTPKDAPATDGKSGKAPKGKPATAAAKAAVAYARAQLGEPYVWGGAGPNGWDCSGLVMRAWASAGVKLPRTTWGQIRAGAPTTRGRLVPGDLVLSYGGGHVGLYIGNGRVIHAPRPGTVVTIAPLPAPRNIVAYRHIRG